METEGKLLLIEGLRNTFSGNPASLLDKKGRDNSAPGAEIRGPGLLPWRMAFRKSENYIVPAALDRAAYVALLLGQPLLLTGEPGAGKSDFARKLAHVLGLGAVEEVHVKTSTLGRDLLYNFDDVARFRDATGKGSDAIALRALSEYVQFNGLGLAIVRSAGPSARVTPVGRIPREIYRGDIELDANGSIPLAALFPAAFGRAEGQAQEAEIQGPTRTVVLIDEIDKAQRDTPNDLLDEIDRMQFDVPELGITIEASPSHWPIVVITSNAERVLPQPFLRRCVFHRLETPEDAETLRTILAARLTEDFSAGPLADDALSIFLALRRSPGQRPPGLSELLAWCLLLERLGFDKSRSLPRFGESLDLLETSLAALSKTDAEYQAAQRVLAAWKTGSLDQKLGATAR